MNDLDKIAFIVNEEVFKDMESKLEIPLIESEKVVKLLNEKSPWEKN